MKLTNIKPREGPLRLQVTDVTGLHTHRARNVQPSSPAGAVARFFAQEMSLPTTVPYALRDDRTGSFLDDDLPIGDQVRDQSHLAVVPKAHLG